VEAVAHLSIVTMERFGLKELTEVEMRRVERHVALCPKCQDHFDGGLALRRRCDLSIQGNIKAMRSLAEPLQVAMDNGARKALIPLENKRNFLEVSGDTVERVDPVFFSDPMTAAMKALGMT